MELGIKGHRERTQEKEKVIRKKRKWWTCMGNKRGKRLYMPQRESRRYRGIRKDNAGKSLI